MQVKKIVGWAMVFMMFCMRTPNVLADTMFTSYTYSFWGEVKEAPEAYVVSEIIQGDEIGCGDFKEPRGLFVKENLVYIADTGNNRVVICDANWHLKEVIESVEIDGLESPLNGPQDVFVSEENDIYIADTGNNRIIRLNNEKEVVSVVGKPESELISSNLKFEPLKIVVDRANRIYVIARNINQGIMEIDSSGAFNGYVGANKVTPKLSDLIWKQFSTKEQRARMELFVPTEFNNIFMDHKGFLYVTTDVIDALELTNVIKTRDDSDKCTPIKKLNSMGTDILKRNGHFAPVGDILLDDRGSIDGPSQIIDVVVDENDIYSILDRKRGRIFTYDFEGNLLYTFGEIGNKAGAFKTPIAIEKVGERILILDFGTNQITEFKPTEYGLMINDALMDYRKGYYDQSADKWEQVLVMNANYELAYVGMGRAAYRNGNFKEALEDFKLGNNHKGYSKTLKLYRKEIIEENFAFIMIGLIGASIGIGALLHYKKKRRRVDGDTKSA